MEKKSIIIEMEEAKQELVQFVNTLLQTHRLSCYLIEPMFSSVCEQIKMTARNEVAQARAKMDANKSEELSEQ